MNLTKSKLNRLIKEELQILLNEGHENEISAPDKDKDKFKLQRHPKFTEDDELEVLGSYISELNKMAVLIGNQMTIMSRRYGGLANTSTHAATVANKAENLFNEFNKALDDMLRFPDVTAAPKDDAERPTSTRWLDRAKP